MVRTDQFSTAIHFVVLDKMGNRPCSPARYIGSFKDGDRIAAFAEFVRCREPCESRSYHTHRLRRRFEVYKVSKVGGMILGNVCTPVLQRKGLDLFRNR